MNATKRIKLDSFERAFFGRLKSARARIQDRAQYMTNSQYTAAVEVYSELLDFAYDLGLLTSYYLWLEEEISHEAVS